MWEGCHAKRLESPAIRRRKAAKWEQKQPVSGVRRRYGPMWESRLFPHRAKTSIVPSFSAWPGRGLRDGAPMPLGIGMGWQMHDLRALGHSSLSSEASLLPNLGCGKAAVRTTCVMGPLLLVAERSATCHGPGGHLVVRAAGMRASLSEGCEVARLLISRKRE